jgi:hypothetical protein
MMQGDQAGTLDEGGSAGLSGSFPIVELRQYTLHEGGRETLIEVFEREFVEPQESVGMKVIGTFRDLDRPNYFVWLRGFSDMDSRGAGLNAFYTGPAWMENREVANATMIDSDDVLLLRAPSPAAKFHSDAPRPALGEDTPAGLIVGTIYYLNESPENVLPVFENEVLPELKAAGIQPLAWFIPETAANNFRLPVREGEKVLAWFARFDSEADHAAQRDVIAGAAAPLRSSLEREPETLRLAPTQRSQLR